MGKFLVIEGLDGSGKSTQVNLLQEYFQNKRIEYKYLHFPRTKEPYYGEMIARFLRGEFGEINNVDPYLVALLYAGDRNDAKQIIEKWLSEDKVVLVDRYVCSNIAFQCAKMHSHSEADELKRWILELEYSYHKIPQPDMSLFLDVPLSFTKEKLTSDREGEDREYLKGSRDIHEESIDFQNKVRESYLEQVKEDPAFIKIDCYDKQHDILSMEEIFKKIIFALEELF